MDNYPQFFTATILEWKHLLKQDKYKSIIISSLQFLVKNERIKLYGFVIMPNHIHLLWHINETMQRQDVQRDFLKYTAQQIKFDLIANHAAVLEKFLVKAKDRKYQIWERNPRCIDLYTTEMIEQKLDYIHCNPIQEHWQLVKQPEEYIFSSAGFYHHGKDEFGLLTHYEDGF